MSPAGFVLVDVMTIWAGTMGLVYLLYLRFAQTMREAPKGSN